MQILASASESQYANDAGEGKGGRWTNHFFGKGRQPRFYDSGKIIEGTGQPGEKPP
jgi:hypothetical protein